MKRSVINLGLVGILGASILGEGCSTIRCDGIIDRLKKVQNRTFFPNVQVYDGKFYQPKNILDGKDNVFFSHLISSGDINHTNHNMRLYLLRQERDSFGNIEEREQQVIYPAGLTTRKEKDGSIGLHYNFKQAKDIGPAGEYRGVWSNGLMYDTSVKNIFYVMYIVYINPIHGIISEKPITDFRFIIKP